MNAERRQMADALFHRKGGKDVTNLLDQVETGRRPATRRVMLYGVQGIGKSNWGAGAERPIFIQTEDGLGEIACDKFPLAADYRQVVQALGEPYSEK
ncbi:MAG: AAA family ATPase, partial [Planctomycetota bacterium]